MEMAQENLMSKLIVIIIIRKMSTTFILIKTN